jgi:hypothetical protein
MGAMRAPTVPPRFPKVESPFDRRENDDGEYVVYDEQNADLAGWREYEAVEKLDGTNCAVYVDRGRVVDAFARAGDKSMNYVEPFGSTMHQRIIRGVQNSVSRGYTDGLADGFHYGETVGPTINGNPHELDELLFIPFEWLREKCSYNSWGEYPQDFDTISGWFENDLFSLFYSKMHGVSLDEASVSDGTFCEGIMFTNTDAQPLAFDTDTRPDAANYAKLRRDMFDWYDGERH